MWKNQGKMVGDVTFSTARHRLQRMILFDFVQKAGRDSCYQCGSLIESVEELSIEHMTPHRSDPMLFWDLDNIAYSHLKCNFVAGTKLGSETGRRPKTKTSTHGMYSYYTNHGCRCPECTNARRIAARVRRGVDKPL